MDELLSSASVQAPGLSPAGLLRPTAVSSYSLAAKTWLQASPALPDRFDLVALNGNLAIRGVHDLVSNRFFDMTVQCEHPSDGWCNHLYFEARNREKVFGTRNLGIGYPFVHAFLGGLEVAAPLFVWQFQLEPGGQNTDQWQVQRQEQHQLIPNYPFFHLVDGQYGTDFTGRARQMAESQGYSQKALGDLCDALRQLLRLDEEGLPFSVQAFDGTVSGPVLRWSAVAGIFPFLPRTTLTEAPVVAPNLPADLDWKHNFTLLPLDPSQRVVLQHVQHNSFTVVEGASGSGKTYLISAIVMNALSNGKKCLVVSKSLSALRRAQKFLLDKGFGDLSFILRDLGSDQLMLADMLRAASDNKARATYDEELYKSVLNRTLREQRKLDEAWEELHEPFFGDQNFTDTVGQFLRVNRAEGKELLLSQLLPQDFSFNYGEYDAIIGAIRTSEPLFRRFPTLQHPLSRLKGTVFLEHSPESGLQWTEQQVQSLLDKATALHHRYITKTNDYTEAVLEHYEQHYSELAGLTKRVREAIEDGVNRFGADFERTTSATEKLYGVFSDHYKALSQEKEKIAEDFEELRKSYSHYRYFEFDFPPAADQRGIKRIGELARDFEASLRLWRRRIPAVVREDVRRLNAKSIHANLDFKEQIKELEYAMDVFVEEFNAVGLYDEQLRHEMLTVPKRQEFLEEVIARLEETQFYLRDFNDFYIWQKHWLSLTPAAQKVVRALCRIKPRNWVAAFESWYLHHLLQHEYAPAMQWEQITWDNFQNGLGELKRLLPFQISAHWQNRKIKALRSLKSADGKSFKTWFGKQNRTLGAGQQAEELFRQQVLPLTETLPVLLVTPQVALDVVQASNLLFDLVLVDEAHNMPKQEAYHLFDMAKNLVVFGDSKQDMTPSAEDDFLEFCKGLGGKSLTLEYQHQDCPEEWIQFNRRAFNTPYKRLPSGRSANEATVVANVEGRYDEAAGTNEAEARQVIDWLNLVEPTPAKTFPVVAIACATVQQRDLIAGQLLRIRQRRAAGFEKIQQLHLNGLGVYQFAELQGQHVDILMLSLTHGISDAQGTLTKHLHFWNTALGVNQLHVALTRATQKIYIAHSIPPGLYTVLAADRHFVGTSILSHLVTFADLIQRGERQAAAEQLEKLSALPGVGENKSTVIPFAQEVEIALQPYFEPNQVKRRTEVAGVTSPLVIETGGREPRQTVLLFDGVLDPTALPSYEWEDRVRQHFRRNGIDFHPTLSVVWWKSPRQEARRLASQLLHGGGKND